MKKCKIDDRIKSTTRKKSEKYWRKNIDEREKIHKSTIEKNRRTKNLKGKNKNWQTKIKKID